MNPNFDFQQEFIDLRDSLESFVFRFLCNRQDVEDIVQDTYIKVLNNIHAFQNKSSFKTWVFAIAANQSKNLLKKQKRWAEEFQDKGESLHLLSKEHMNRLKNVYMSVPDVQFELIEHINYCFNCITKTLSLPQQICLLLKEVHQFKIKEIIEISGLTEGQVKHNLTYARKIMTRVFDNRCALIKKQGVCNQCSELMGILNSEQNAWEEVNQLKLVKQKETADDDHLLDLRISLIKNIHPLKAANSHLHTYMLEHLPKWAEVDI